MPLVHPRLRKRLSRCLRLRFSKSQKARTAGHISNLQGACDYSPLSCALSNGFHRPKSAPKVWLFRSQQLPRISPKVTATTLLQTVFNFSLPHVCFHGRKRYTRLSEKDRLATAYTLKQGRFGRGGITTLRTVPARFRKPCVARGVERQTLPFWVSVEVLPKNAESLRDSDALMRVAVPHVTPLGCVIFYFPEVAACTLRSRAFRVCRDGVVSPLLTCSACC